jgi:hypothetical protein
MNMATIEQRIERLEELSPNAPKRWERIILAGYDATPLEQAQIEKYQQQGCNVVIRKIVTPNSI